MDVNSDVGALINTFIEEINLVTLRNLILFVVCGFQFTFCVQFTAQMCKIKRLKSGSTSTNSLGVLTLHEWAFFFFFFSGEKFFVEHSEFTLWLWVFCLNVGVWEKCHFTPAIKACRKLDSESCFQTEQNKFTEVRTSWYIVCARDIPRNKDFFFFFFE